jgi:hypothetical protein
MVPVACARIRLIGDIMNLSITHKWNYLCTFAALVCLTTLSTCGRQHDSPSQANPPAKATAPEQALSNGASDSNLPSLNESMGQLMKLTRQVTAWHKGATPIIRLTYDSSGNARDESGHQVAISQTQWDGIINLIAKSKRPVPMLTPREAIPDGLGDLPRVVYDVDFENTGMIRFTKKGTLDTNGNR